MYKTLELHKRKLSLGYEPRSLLVDKEIQRDYDVWKKKYSNINKMYKHLQQKNAKPIP